MVYGDVRVVAVEDGYLLIDQGRVLANPHYCGGACGEERGVPWVHPRGTYISASWSTREHGSFEWMDKMLGFDLVGNTPWMLDDPGYTSDPIRT